MATLILDIKTAGEPWDTLDEATKAYLMRSVNRTARGQAERQLVRDQIKDDLSFSPFTGSLVALSVYDRDRAEGVVYTAGGGTVVPESLDGIGHKVCSETVMLTDLWDGIRRYDTVVTFAGRSFVLPFLLHRSVACGVVPTSDLLRKRYLRQQQPPYHIDLQDELSFYGGLTRRPALHLVCRAYGIAHEAEAEEAVTALVKAGKWGDLARLSARDLRATTGVYEKWLQYLAPRDLVQKIDF